MQGYGGVQIRKDAFDKWWKALGPLLVTASAHTASKTRAYRRTHLCRSTQVYTTCCQPTVVLETKHGDIHAVGAIRVQWLTAFHRAQIDQLIGWAFNDLLPRRLASATASKREMLQSLVIMGIRGTGMQLSLRARAEELQGPRRVVVALLPPPMWPQWRASMTPTKKPLRGEQVFTRQCKRCDGPRRGYVSWPSRDPASFLANGIHTFCSVLFCSASLIDTIRPQRPSTRWQARKRRRLRQLSNCSSH